MRSEPEAALAVDHVTKQYILRGGVGGAGALKTTLLSFPSLLFDGQGHHTFTALNDISFTLRPGECIGLIGANGSGKSTLLRICAGITRPTSGSVKAHGRVSALLELGAGFQPQINGRENALFNAVLLGLSIKEAREVLPSIIEFSELGEFIEQPMRMYSSGMYVRLGFAVAVHVEPEILLVDEVLAVGDAEFQSKCFGYIERLREQGVSIVLASHDLQSMQRYTDRVILLEHGRMALEGTSAEAVHEYLLRSFPPAAEAGKTA